MANVPERLEIALGAMGTGGPRNLRAYLEQPGPDFEKANADKVEMLIDLILAPDPNQPARSRVQRTLDTV